MTGKTPRARWELIREGLLAKIRLGRFGPGAKLPSERNLARDLGVSHPTVHKALASLAADGVVIREVGRGTFVTDAAARRTGAIALYFGKWANPFEDPILFRVCSGISAACAERGLDLFFHTPWDIRFSSPAEYLDSILGRGCDGLLCLADVRSEVVEEAAERLPTVLAANRRVSDNVPRLVTDQASAVAAGVRHLASLGRGRIALAGSSHSDYVEADAIVAGYREALAEAGLDYDESIVSCTDPSVPGELRYSSTPGSQYWIDRRILSRGRAPDAIVGINPGMGRSAFELAAAEGMRMPDEIALVSVIDGHWAANAKPSVTTVNFLSEEVGRQALELLEDAIEGRADADTVRYGSAPVVVRESCGAPEEMRTPARPEAMAVIQ